jgi:hypothetical protein
MTGIGWFQFQGPARNNNESKKTGKNRCDRLIGARDILSVGVLAAIIEPAEVG